MGGTITLVAGGVVFLLAVTTDAHTTIEATKVIIGVRGVTFICKKALASIDKDKAELLDFAGWCIAGLSIVTILALARQNIQPLVDQYHYTAGQIKAAGEYFHKAAEILDKITPWD